jgi:hypothetical protein
MNHKSLSSAVLGDAGDAGDAGDRRWMAPSRGTFKNVKSALSPPFSQRVKEHGSIYICHQRRQSSHLANRMEQDV